MRRPACPWIGIAWQSSLLLLPCLSGCLPYGYPTAACVPPIRPGCDPTEVHAFRVDTTRYQGDLDFLRGTACETIQLTPLPCSADGTWPQPRLSFDHGLAVLTPPLSNRTLHSHSVAVRLYRPGYELVEIKEGDRLDSITWKPAPNWLAREKALDDLFGLSTHCDLLPGSASEGHRQALLFGVEEYGKAASGPCEPAVAADKLQQLAER